MRKLLRIPAGEPQLFLRLAGERANRIADAVRAQELPEEWFAASALQVS
jgi:hypothetical protein